MAKKFKIRNSTAKFEGKREIKKLTDFYNLDTTIPVGYRVKSICTTQFRQWCTYVLRQFAIKDYMINKKQMSVSQRTAERYETAYQCRARYGRTHD